MGCSNVQFCDDQSTLYSNFRNDISAMANQCNDIVEKINILRQQFSLQQFSLTYQDYPTFLTYFDYTHQISYQSCSQYLQFIINGTYQNQKLLLGISHELQNLLRQDIFKVLEQVFNPMIIEQSIMIPRSYQHLQFLIYDFNFRQQTYDNIYEIFEFYIQRRFVIGDMLQQYLICAKLFKDSHMKFQNLDQIRFFVKTTLKIFIDGTESMEELNSIIQNESLVQSSQNTYISRDLSDQTIKLPPQQLSQTILTKIQDVDDQPSVLQHTESLKFLKPPSRLRSQMRSRLQQLSKNDRNLNNRDSIGFLYKEPRIGNLSQILYEVVGESNEATRDIAISFTRHSIEYRINK